jgi:hypothetical protein
MFSIPASLPGLHITVLLICEKITVVSIVHRGIDHSLYRGRSYAGALSDIHNSPRLPSCPAPTECTATALFASFGTDYCPFVLIMYGKPAEEDKVTEDRLLD